MKNYLTAANLEAILQTMSSITKLGDSVSELSISFNDSGASGKLVKVENDWVYRPNYVDTDPMGR